MVRTKLREKGHNCDGTKRKTLNIDDRHSQIKNLEWGRYLMACRTLGIHPNLANRAVIPTRRQRRLAKNRNLAKRIRG